MVRANPNVKESIYPLYGWHIGNGQVVLESGLEIRRVDYFSGEGKLIDESGLDVRNYTHVLAVAPYPITLVDALTMDPTTKAREVEMALRVFCSGEVGLAAYVPITDPSAYQIFTRRNIGRDQAYKIDQSGLDGLPAFFKLYNDAYRITPLAFMYFSDIYEKNSILDKAIYYCSVLESLFVPPKTRGEKSIYIRQGATKLQFSQKEIQTLTSLYTFRNNVLHANFEEMKRFIKSGQYSSLFYRSQDLVRKALKKYVEKPWTPTTAYDLVHIQK